MAENPKETKPTKNSIISKTMKKRLLHIGLFFTKPILWLMTLLLLADGGFLAALIYYYDAGSFLTLLCAALFTAFTTALLLLAAAMVFQYCSLKAKLAFHLLEDMKELLIQTEQNIHRHLQERQEKKFRRAVCLALENLQADSGQQKELLNALQTDLLNTPEEGSPLSPAGKKSRLEQLEHFLSQSLDMFAYFQQIYGQLQGIAISDSRLSAALQQAFAAAEEIWLPLYEKVPPKIKHLCEQIQTLIAQGKENKAAESMEQQEKIDHEYDDLLKEILSEVNRLREQLEQIHLSE